MAIGPKRIQKLSDRQTTTLVIGLLLGFFAGAVTVSLVAYGQGNPADLWQWLDGFAQNIGTEIFGAFLTFLLLERLVRNLPQPVEGAPRDREAEQERRYQLVAINQLQQAGSKEARQPILNEMQARGLLKHVALVSFDLSHANLVWADLSEAHLIGANLGKARLSGANLHLTDLSYANLQGADLNGAFLVQANLHRADLHNANLTGANLRGAELDWANLDGAILPDGSRQTAAVDMQRFTNPAHPDFYLVESGWS